MKQVKEAAHDRRRTRPLKETFEHKASSGSTKKRNKKPEGAKAVHSEQESLQEANDGAEETAEGLEEELRVKEALYLSNLSSECRILRERIDKQLDTHLRAIGAIPERGNTRQRQIRQMSWSFVSGDQAKYPKGFELLPCALNGSEVYQFTHLVNAFFFTLQGGEITAYEERALTPLVIKAEDKMQALEARKALYTFLLAQVPRTQEEKQEKREREPTLKDVYILLKEVKELLIHGEREEHDA